MAKAVSRQFHGVTVGLAVMTLTATVWAEASELLSRGRQLMDSFEFDAAVEELEAVLADPSTTATHRIEALELISVIHFNLNRRDLARVSYENLLALDYGHELRDTSYPPRLLRFFGSIKESFIPQANLPIEARAFEVSSDNGTIHIEVSLESDTGGVDRVLAMIRSPGEETYRRTIMRRDGLNFFAEIPNEDEGIEFYVEVQAPSGAVLGMRGSPESPMGMSEEPDEADVTTAVAARVVSEDDPDETRRRRPVYRSWWFWTIIGVVAAGGAAAAIVLTLPEEQEAGSLGTRSLP